MRDIMYACNFFPRTIVFKNFVKAELKRSNKKKYQSNLWFQKILKIK
jgi:hypothetical protein